jgi:hypothetical protein
LSGVVAISAGSNAALFNLGETYANATFRICATYETSDGRESSPSEIFVLTAAPLTNLIEVVVPTGFAKTNVYSTDADGTVFRLVASTTAGAVTFNPARGGRELTTLNTLRLPGSVERVCFVKGVCYVAEYFPSSDTTVIWFSQPFAYHLFDQAEDYIVVLGRVSMLLWISKEVYSSIKDWLLIGSTAGVWIRDDEGKLENLASYGVLPGTAGDVDPEGTAWFWTKRGICTAYPFKNLTETDVSMAPGLRAASALLYQNGTKQLITVTQGGGTPFNQRRERT